MTMPTDYKARLEALKTNSGGFEITGRTIEELYSIARELLADRTVLRNAIATYFDFANTDVLLKAMETTDAPQPK